jgi:hypothetical protein
MPFRPDVLIEIRYRVRDGEAPEVRIRTNAKKEAIEELLGEWVTDRMFMTHQPPRNLGEPEERAEYLIRIGYKLEPESWSVESDTGNDDLTIGIVIDTVSRLDSAEISGPA